MDLRSLQSTGISVNDELISTFNDFKLKRTEFKFLVMKIVGDEVVLDKGVGKEVAFDAFATAELTAEPAYIAIDFDYKTTDDRDADKLILLSWIPDDAKIKMKMKYAGTKEAVKSALVGIALNINATDRSEANIDVFNAECNKV